MIRTIPLTRRRLAVVLQFSCYPLILLLRQVVGLPTGLAAGLALIGFVIASVYLYYRTGLWHFGNAPDEQVDERQIQIRNQAYRYAYVGLSLAVMLGIIFVTLAVDFRWSLPTTYEQLSPLFWVAWTFVMTLPSSILAWTEPDVYGRVDGYENG